MSLPEDKFTEEVKNAWIVALKSGKYTQGDVYLKQHRLDGTIRHCCIGVLAEIHDKLAIPDTRDGGVFSPYKYLVDTVGNTYCDLIWETNDNTFDEKNKNYENVIPIIEELPVTE